MEHDRFIIDPRQHRKDRPYIIGLSAFVLVILIIGIIGARTEAPGWWLTGLAAMLLMPFIHACCTWRRADLFQVSPDGELTLHRGRKDRRPARFSRGDALELTLDYYSLTPGQDGESVATLNFWDTTSGTRKRRRHIIGTWISPAAKRETLHRLHTFLTRHGFHVTALDRTAKDRK